MTLIEQRDAIASELTWSAVSPCAEVVPLQHVTTLGSVVGEVARESAALLAVLRQLVDRVGDEISPSLGESHANRALRWLGPYRIESFVRSGGMGDIHRAIDERLGRTVALKVLTRRHGEDTNGRRRLFAEARLLSAVRHPNVCTLYDVGTSGGVDFLVLEYLDGSTLREWLAAGALPLPQALAIGRQIADALDAVHRAGVVHWDLKPANIMLSGRREDAVTSVKLIDFGLARPVARSGDQDAESITTRTDPNQVQGTWPYMAPEQLTGGVIDPRTDIWALGVVLYEMVCGRRPFEERSPAALTTSILGSTPARASQVNSECSIELAAVIERCLMKDKESRWSSCAELAERLDDCMLGRVRRRSLGPRQFARRIAAVASVWCAVALGLPAVSRAEVAPAPATVITEAADGSVAESPADRAHMEAFLRHGRIGKLQPIGVGVSGSARASLSWQGATHDAHVQTVDTFIRGSSRHANQSDNYRYNVAAYRLDRMLGLGMVPVSVERAVKGRQAAVTWWIDDVEMMEIERRKLGRRPADVESWNRQAHRAAIFHELIANSDANQTNQLVTTDGTIWLVDFTRAFRLHRKLSRPQSLKRLDPELRAALERLDRAGLRAEMRGLLDSLQIAGILKRRDLILDHFGSGTTGPPAGGNPSPGQV